MNALAARPIRASYRVMGKERAPPIDWVHLIKSMVVLAWIGFPLAWILAQLTVLAMNWGHPLPPH